MANATTLRKRIAAVAVAAVGFGMVSAVPASAAAPAAAEILFDLQASGIYSTSDISIAKNATSSANKAKTTRVGAVLAVDGIDEDGSGDLNAGTAKVRARIYKSSTAVASGSWVTYGDTSTTAFVTVPAACAGLDTCTVKVQVDYDGVTTGTGDQVVSTANAVLRVVLGGAPAAAVWTHYEFSDTWVDPITDKAVVALPGVTWIRASSSSYGMDLRVVDAAGKATLLLDTESIAVEATVGTTPSTVTFSDPEITATEDYSTSATRNWKYNTAFGDSGTIVAGTVYTLHAQLLDGATAIGSVATTTFRRLANTAALTGSLVFKNYNDELISTQRVPAGTATDTAYVWLTDTAGRIVDGAPLAITSSGNAGTLSATADATEYWGGSAGFDFTPTANSTTASTVTATVVTGTGTITGSYSVIATAANTATGDDTEWTVAANDGSGIDGSDNAYSVALDTTSFNVSLAELDANKLVNVTFTSTTGGTEPTNRQTKVNGSERSQYVLTNADGVASVTIKTPAAADGEEVTVTIAGSTLTITFEDEAAALTTSPANGKTIFAVASSTQSVTASVKNQFAKAVTGGYIEFSQSARPTGELPTGTQVKSVSAAGEATFSVALGATAGTYSYTATAKAADGTTLDSSSFSFLVSATGAPASLTITSGVDTATAFYAVTVDSDGKLNGAVAASAATKTAALAAPGAWTAVTVSVKNSSAAGIDDVAVVATPGAGVYVNSTTTVDTKFSAMNAASDLTQYTTGGGTATFYVFATKAGTATISFAAGAATVSGSFSVKAASGPVVRKVAAAATAAVTASAITQVTATVTDAWGNPVKGADVSGAITGVAGRFAGGARTSGTLTTDAAGQVVFEVTGLAGEAGAGLLTITVDDADVLTGDLSKNLASLAKDEVAEVEVALTVAASTVKSPAEVAAEKAAADAAKAVAAVTAVQTTITAIQTAISTLVASFTSTLLLLQNKINRIMKKLGIK